MIADSTGSRWSRLSRWIRSPESLSTLIYLGAAGLAKGAAIVLVPIYTRQLESAAYADYMLVLTAIGMLSPVLSLGLANAVVRAYFDATPEEGTQKSASLARWLVVVTGALALGSQLVALLLLGDGPGIGSRAVVSMVTWAAAGSGIGAVVPLYLKAARKPMWAAGIQLFQFISALSAGLVLVIVLDRGVRGAIEAACVASAAEGLVGLAFVFGYLRGAVQPGSLRAGLRFSLPLVPHVLANQLQGVADRWVFKALGLEPLLGRYAVATQLAAPVALVVGAHNDTAAASLGEVWRSSGRHGLAAALPRHFKAYALSAALPGLVLVTTIPLLHFVVGPRFASGLVWLPALAAIAVIEALYYPSSNAIYYAAPNPRAIAAVTLSSGLLSLGLNVLLVPTLGVLGAVTARAVALSVRAAAMWLVARRVLAAGS